MKQSSILAETRHELLDDIAHIQQQYCLNMVLTLAWLNRPAMR